MEEIANQTITTLHKITLDLQKHLIELQAVNKATNTNYQTKVGKVFEDKIVNNLVDLNMA